MSGPAPLSVASAPRRHVYTRHLCHPAVPVRHVATPDATYRAAQVMDPVWVEANAQQIDVAHVHFGFGDVPMPQVRAWRAALRRHGIPLVHTVHDITNPHVEDQQGHVRRRDLLLQEADALVTLTPRAATVVQRLCGRRPVVVPHPHVVDLGRMARPRRRRDPSRLVVGLHAKDHRPGIDALPWLEALLEVMADRHDMVLRLDLRPRMAERRPDLHRRLHALSTHPRVQVHHTGYWPDPLLWDYLQALDLVVLPYRLGTHSGWAEACVDLGTPVLAPAHLALADQHPPPWIRAVPVGPSGPDVEALAAAVDAVRLGPEPTPAPARWRAAQRQAVARAHERLYRDLLDAGQVAA